MPAAVASVIILNGVETPLATTAATTATHNRRSKEMFPEDASKPQLLSSSSRPKIPSRRAITISTSAPATGGSTPFLRGLPPKSPSSATSSLRLLASQATLRGRSRRKDKKQRKRSKSRSSKSGSSTDSSSSSSSSSSSISTTSRSGSSRRSSSKGRRRKSSSSGSRHRTSSCDSANSSMSASSFFSPPHQPLLGVVGDNQQFPSSSISPQHQQLDADLRNSLVDLILDDEATTSTAKNSTSSSSFYPPSSSPTSVGAFEIRDGSTENGNSAQSRSSKGHRRSNSWSSPMFDGWDEKEERDESSPSKTCMPKFFKRSRAPKVPCADVASVGNASDTLLESGASGREMHEAAKHALIAGDFQTARNMFFAIQRAQLDRFGEDHPSVGAAMHNVGVVQLRMGHHEQAEQTLKRAVTVRRKIMGADHLDVALTLSKLGASRIVLLKFEEGLIDLNEALLINRKQLGNDHKLVAQTLCQMACLYFEAGELEAAQVTFEEALDIFRSEFQKESILYGQTVNVYNPMDTTNRDAIMSHITDTLCNIGSIQNKLKQHLDAEESFREALDLQRGTMGHDHPRVIATIDNLAYSYSKSKDYRQALTCYKEMLSAQLSHHNGTFTEDCCITLQKQNCMYIKLHHLEGAIEETKKALAKLYAAAGAQSQHNGGTESAEDAAMANPVLQKTEQVLSALLLKRIKKTRKSCSKGCF